MNATQFGRGGGYGATFSLALVFSSIYILFFAECLAMLPSSDQGSNPGRGHAKDLKYDTQCLSAQH